MIYPVGIDVSRHNGAIDWHKAYAACCAAGPGVPFAAIRCTVGDYYTDPLFDANWGGAKMAGFLVTAYHVVTPEISAPAQMAHFRQAFGARYPDIPVVLDVELSRNQTSRSISNCVRGCALHLHDFHHPRPFIYTAAGFWDAWIERSIAWSAYPLWVANYTSAPAPWLPEDWRAWAVWQWSAGGNRQGADYGASSADIDLNRWGAALPYPTVGQMEDDEMTGSQFNDIMKALEKISDRLGQMADRVDKIIELVEELTDGGIDITPGEPEPEVPPVDSPYVYDVQVKADKTLANVVKSFNNAGRPLMVIYSSDGTVAGRKRFDKGAELEVIGSKVQADGGSMWWLLAEEGEKGEDLYVRAADVVKL